MDTTDVKTIEYEIDEYLALKNYIEPWFGNYEKELKEKDNEFVLEVAKENPEWVKERRITYLDEELDSLNRQYVDIYAGAEESKSKISESWLVEVLENGFIKPTLKEIAKKIKRYTFEKSCWESPETIINSNGVTQDEIETAKNVDWELIVRDFKQSSAGRKLTKCLWHEDSNPSLTLYPSGKGGYCFVCSKNIDTIEYVMKFADLTFVDAVKYLNTL